MYVIKILLASGTASLTSEYPACCYILPPKPFQIYRCMVNFSTVSDMTDIGQIF